jgi:hypothetical protein
MSVKLSDFASGVTLTDTDHVVGYSNTNTGGERKWTVANLRNSLITGAATTIDTENLTGSRALISDASGKVAASDISTTKLNYLTDVTANIQGQINTKGPGTVTSVTGSAPISVATGTTTPAISISEATQSAAGAMSSTDKTRLDDASGVNGLVKCNGSGNFSVAVANTDYLTSTSNIVPKALVNFSINNVSPFTVTINNQFNVSSITRYAAGRYKINFTNPVGTNRCVVAMAENYTNSARGSTVSIANADTPDLYVNPAEVPFTTNYVWIQTTTVDSDPANRDHDRVTLIVI